MFSFDFAFHAVLQKHKIQKMRYAVFAKRVLW